MATQNLGRVVGEKGDQGIQGDKGAAFTYDDFTAEQLASLKGVQGDKGEPGTNGTNGTNGADGLTTDIVVGGNTFTQVDGTITFPQATQTQAGAAKIWVEGTTLNIVTE